MVLDALIMPLAALAAAFYIAWSIGANDASNTLGAAVGSRALSFKTSLAIGVVLSLAGALLFGQHVSKTLAFDIIHVSNFSLAGAILVAAAAGIFITAASLKGMSISTGHTIVGAILGYGLAISTKINWITISDIVLSWVISPFIALAVGALFYFALKRLLFVKIKNLLQRARIERTFVTLQIISVSLLALSFGANDVAKAVGIFSGLQLPISGVFLLLFGALGIGIGIVTLGPRVMETVAIRIVNITPARGFISQVAASLVILAFTAFGMPISTTHTAIGAIIGTGFGGLGKVNRRIIAEIVTSWILTVPISAALAFVLTWVIL